MSILSRRSVVASAAALPALAVPVVAVASIEPDPIYAAIEEYNRAKEPVERDDASRAEVNAALAARLKLCETSPTTTAGLRAFLDLAATEQDRLDVPLPDDHEEMMLFIRSLARSVQGLAHVNVVVPDTYQGDAICRPPRRRAPPLVPKNS